MKITTQLIVLDMIMYGRRYSDGTILVIILGLLLAILVMSGILMEEV